MSVGCCMMHGLQGVAVLTAQRLAENRLSIASFEFAVRFYPGWIQLRRSLSVNKEFLTSL